LLLSGDGFEMFQGTGILNVTSLSLDEPTMEAMVFADDEGGDEDRRNERSSL